MRRKTRSWRILNKPRADQKPNEAKKREELCRNIKENPAASIRIQKAAWDASAIISEPAGRKTHPPSGANRTQRWKAGIARRAARAEVFCLTRGVPVRGRRTARREG